MLTDQAALQVGENQGLLRSQKAVAAEGPAEGLRSQLAEQ